MLCTSRSPLPKTSSAFIRRSHTPSSTRWLARQKSDPFVRDRTRGDGPESAYRSRAAFKLLEMQKRFRLLKRGSTVIDLGCAPGAWLQVVSEIVRPGPAQKNKVIGVDVLRIDPLLGVESIQGDFLTEDTHRILAERLGGSGASEDIPVDIILSDLAANATGNRTTDVMNTLRLCEAAYIFVQKHLRSASVTTSSERAESEKTSRMQGGHLVMKYFAHPLLEDFKKGCLLRSFKQVCEFKPKASRSESSECYWVCLDWQGRPPSPSG